MAGFIPGRYTAPSDEPIVVFLIGMRVNRLRSVKTWLTTFRAMGGMLQTLNQHPEKGFKGGQLILYGRGVGLIQYWRSFEDLEKFARSPSEPHLKAWQRFNHTAGKDGSVGVWHETYMVEPGRYEAIYANMPFFGLATATGHVKAVGGRATARRRVGGDNQPAVDSADQEETPSA